MNKNYYNICYLNYKCYKHLRERLDVPEYSEKKKNNLESALKTLGEAQYNEFFKHDILKNLAARLGNNGIFYFISPNTVCNYINYKLNESLRKHFSHKSEIDYSIFKAFAKEFYYKEHNNYNEDKSCEIYIKDLGDEVYNRMVLLYNIYYYYNELKSPYKAEYRDSKDNLCYNLKLLILNSNEAINQNKINKDSIGSIKNLKDIIKTDDKSEQYQQKCDLNLLELMLTELPNSKVTISREAEPTLDSDAVPETEQHDELELQSADAENEHPPSQLESEDEKARDLAPHELTPHELTPHELAPQELAQHQLAAKVEELGIHVKGVQAGIYPTISRQVTDDQDVTGLLKGRYRSQHPEAPREGTEGLLGKMQGFFTETLGQVEPAPILGVSGGMGALFLLFKVFIALKIYTYVYNTFK
ncbi:hypothetical protein PVNG_04472 [Plasmodium vivax North Korean]|uniref:Uncharacterized protein n=1 Tax=Plasmodium vivax North Korean TaxID=1035514 RepID=A0A0J9U1Y3_PLAVI|nr:hypothetical protein PVNG_04472 [Plasmodium vivax North Korean]